MAKKFYITTPIYYVNSVPHIGHAYSTIVADCLARFRRDRGMDVCFLTGTDEHGQKIQKAADEQGLTPQEFTNKIAPKFKELWKVLEISNDDFIRTTEHRHIEAVQAVLNTLKDSDNLYEGEYGGWYCVPCETFWTEAQLIEKKCPDCHREVEYIKEKNYFFRLSKYQGWLSEYLKKNPDFIFPKTRYNEVVSFLDNNTLEDLCISRPKTRLNWGIPLPFDPEHVTYVWFDALINYISAIGYIDNKSKFKNYWPADIHIMAKDILRQHAIYWPIILKALGLELPGKIVAHGWWKMGEIKMSKSVGNVVDPFEMVEKYGTDSFRYFLMRDVTFGTDGNFSTESFEKRFNSDLANDLGNLVYRTLNMVEKYTGGSIPKAPEGKNAPQYAKDAPMDYDLSKDIDALDFSSALESVWKVIGYGNKLIEVQKPWNLKKEGKEQDLLDLLGFLIQIIKFSAEKISPFMPDTSESILQQVSGDKIQKGGPLFPRLETVK